MRLLLVNPRFPESFWGFDRIQPITGTRYNMANLALPTLAAMVPPEIDVAIVDENVEEIDLDHAADLVGITAFNVQGPRAFALAEEFRRRGRKVMIGGAYATLCHEDVRPHCDILFRGEAERTFPEFIKDWTAGRIRDEYWEQEMIDMTLAPLPRFELLTIPWYNSMTVQFSRGCPFTCEFCDIIIMFGRRPRAKPIAKLMAEIERLRQLGASSIFLVDDNFIGNPKLAKTLLRELADWNRRHHYPVSFYTEASLNAAHDDELLALLRAANFTHLFVGIESPRKESLLESKKRQNTKGDIVSDVHKLQQSGLTIQAGMIVGFDHDDPEIFREQFDFIQEARIPVSMTGLLNAMPKTPLYDRLAAAGRLLGKTIGDQLLHTNIVPQGMSRQQLLEGYAWLLDKLYDYDAYVRRCLALLLAERAAGVARAKLTWSNIETLWNVFWKLLIFTGWKRRMLGLKILLPTLLRRPGRLAEAVTLVVLHKHLYEFAQLARAQALRSAEVPV